MKKNYIKKIIVGILTVALILSGIMFQPSSADKVEAAATTVGDCYVERLDISKWKEKDDEDVITAKVPVASNVSNPEDWLFAGWYTDASCGTAVSSNVVEGMYFAKFVPAEVLTVKCQLSTTTKTFEGYENACYVLRMISSVDSLRYQNVEFVIQAGEEEPIHYIMNSVSKFIQASENTETYTYYPTIFHDVSVRFATANMKIEDTESELSKAIKITPYWTTLDGTKVAGETKEMLDGVKTAAENAETVTKEDTSWYNSEEIEFTINNAAELYGFATLVNNGTLANKTDITIKLGKDILVNAGDASTWSSTVKPLNEWTPIGDATNPFAGTFDGQGHAIRGIYCMQENVVGLFGVTTKDTLIKNFTLDESFFGSNDADVLYLGSIVGYGGGNIESVYSKASIVTTATGNTTNPGNDHYVGGIIGLVNIKNENTIDNCWFAGPINTIGRQVGGLVGCINNASVPLTVKHCLSAATEFEATHTTGAPRIGGLCGYISNTKQLTIDDCLNTSVIQSPAANKNYVAAMLGRLSGGTVTINNSYALTDTWTRALDKSPSISPTITETIDGTTTTLTASDLLVEEASLASKALDITTYWEITSSTQKLRNFESDIRWFNEREEGQTEFTLTTAAQLYGFAELTNQGEFSDASDVFKITLAADIIVNDGEAIKWATNAPTNTWTPIGNSTYNFAATFDGQGHIISGIYCPGTRLVGLFGYVSKDGVIRDLRLENSYFYANHEVNSTAYIGSIVARNGGCIEKVYSNATIETVGYASNSYQGVGGIIGLVETDAVESSPNKISNCWFAGTISSSMRANGGIVGIVMNENCTSGTVYLTIEHCLNTGVIKNLITTAACRAGGFVGYVNATNGKISLKITDCLNLGMISTNNAANAKYTCSIIGRVNSDNCTADITSTYATYESCAKTHDTEFISNASITQIYEEAITGIEIGEAETQINLNTDYWIGLNDTAPVLKSFYTQQ